MAGESFPQTLTEAVVYYNNPETAHAEMCKFRWPDGIVKCPTCGSTAVYFIAARKVWQCKATHPKRQFSVKVGSIMEDSALSISKWLIAVWLITNAKNGISSYELARSIGVSQKSAWHMLHRIRLAMQSDSEKFDGTVEVDETYIGGLARFMHKDKRDRVMKGKVAGRSHLVPVVGAIKRGKNGEPSQAVVRVVKNSRRSEVMPFVREHVKAEDAILYTDALRSYEQHPVRPEFTRQVIDHAVSYVNGDIHTNNAENFWSLVKRMLKGTYISVEPYHLFRYLDEQVFRFNNRKLSDAGRFCITAGSVFGKRLTWQELTAADASL